MGQSTNGQICYGIEFEDGDEFPWDDEKYDMDMDEWWLEVNNYNRSGYPYDEGGNYKQGLDTDSPEVAAWHDRRSKWLKDHPIPVTMVNTCSGNCPQYIMAIPETFLSAWRGYPKKFDPAELVQKDGYIERLKQFCAMYEINIDSKPVGWFLSSYWG